MEKIFYVAIGLVVLAAVFALPGAWLVMLALGNFGFAEFGLVDCLPAGAVVGVLASKN